MLALESFGIIRDKRYRKSIIERERGKEANEKTRNIIKLHDSFTFYRNIDLLLLILSLLFSRFPQVKTSTNYVDVPLPDVTVSNPR